MAPASCPPMTALRPAVPADLPAIRALVAAAYGHYVARIGQRPGPMRQDYAAEVAAGQVLLAEDAQGLAGVLVLVAQADAMLIDNVAVAPDWQGHGLGRQLMAHAEDVARAAGLGRMRLYTHVLMVENRAFYARLGYAETRFVTEAGLDRVYMEKPLR